MTAMFKNIYVDKTKNKFTLWTTDGKKIEQQFKCRSWVDNPGYTETPYRSITGTPVVPVFDTYLNEKAKRDDAFNNDTFINHESDIPPEIRILSEIYEKQEDLKFKIEQYNIFYFDIETDTGDGFPEPEEAARRVNLISCYDSYSKMYVIFGLHSIDEERFAKLVEDKEKEFQEKFQHIKLVGNYKYVDCHESEEDLLCKFFEYCEEVNPDIYSGYNTNKFDIPYLINRSKRLMLQEYTLMSPVRRCYCTKKWNEDFMKFELQGVIAGKSCIDYLPLYKEFTKSQGQKESYKLDFIADLELKIGKVKLGDSGLSLADKDFTAFALYNLVDSVLIDLLEFKLKMIESLIATCSEARIPLEYFFVSKRVILGFFMTYMHRKGIVIPASKNVEKEKYDGAYIKMNPKAYTYVASVDAKAMYPSIIVSCNISPETKIISSTDPGNCSRSVLRNVYYSNSLQGIVPEIVSTIVKSRDAFKKKQKAHSDPSSSDYDPELADFYKKKQNAYKIFANSVYGLLGNNHFQFYDVDNAASITGIGNRLIQHVITYATTWIDNKLPTSERFKNEFGEYANVTLKGELDKDYVESFIGDSRNMLGKYKRLVLAHTDSFFFDYSDIYAPFEKKERTYEEYLSIKNRFSDKNSSEYNESLKKYFDGMNDENWNIMSFTEFMLRFNHCVFDEVMGKITKKWATMHNYYEDHMWFKLEKCCSNLIALTKAHYICNLQYDEGDLLINQPFSKRMKAVGVEIVKSDTPKWSKEIIINTLEKMFDGASKQEISKYIGMLKKDYSDVENIVKISRPATINTLSPTKANTFPAPRRGALIWNQLLKDDSSFNEYEEITPGTKVKWVAVKEPNKFGIGAISYNSQKWPIELNKYFTIDHATQFEKTFKKPLEKIMEINGWGNVFDGNVDSIRRFFKAR